MNTTTAQFRQQLDQCETQFSEIVAELDQQGRLPDHFRLGRQENLESFRFVIASSPNFAMFAQQAYYLALCQRVLDLAEREGDHG